ncbi:hypothetical protein D3C80_2168130 [compost metagenome]
MMTGMEDMNNRGFYLGNVRNVRFHQVTVENHEGPAFYIENGDRVELIGCESRNTRKPEQLDERVTLTGADLNLKG